MSAGEATREYYREQGRQQERQRMTETEAIRENYNLGVLAGEAREQQRIIKLLNRENIRQVLDGTFIPDGEGGMMWEFDTIAKQLIALIKGEK